MQQPKNKLKLAGRLFEMISSYSVKNKKFSKWIIKVARKSGVIDYLPVVIADGLVKGEKLSVGDCVVITGDMRSHDWKTPVGISLLVFGHAYTVEKIDQITLREIQEPNIVEITSYVCQVPTFRKTKFDRVISDIKISCNRLTNNTKVDYIPTIAWGPVAIFAKSRRPGDLIKLVGRFQSRTFSHALVGIKTVYEVSASRFDLCKNIGKDRLNDENY